MVTRTCVFYSAAPKSGLVWSWEAPTRFFRSEFRQRIRPSRSELVLSIKVKECEATLCHMLL